MKIALMGAGYVGMALLPDLQNRADEVIITTTTPLRLDSLRAFGSKVILLDNSGMALHELVDVCDAIIILIAPKSPEDYEETYLNTAKRLSQVINTQQKPLKIIYTSSTSVYEGSQEEWVTEDLTVTPQSFKAKILLQTEEFYLTCKADACVLRLGGIYGPGREIASRIKSFSGKAMPGTGEEPTNNIHLHDIVNSIQHCLDKELTGIYNLVNDDHTSRKNLYQPLCEKAGLPLPVWQNAPSVNSKSYKVSNAKIKNTGFVFTS